MHAHIPLHPLPPDAPTFYCNGWEAVDELQSNGIPSTELPCAFTPQYLVCRCVREYGYAEHYSSVKWDLVGVMLATVFTSAIVGYLFLGRAAPVYVLIIAVSFTVLETFQKRNM